MVVGIVGECELATAKPWDIYSLPPERLPTSPGRKLLPVAIEEIVRRVHKARSRNPAPTDDNSSKKITWETDRLNVASSLMSLLRERRISSTARKVGGGTPFPLGRAHWDSDAHMQIAATGVIAIETTPDKWIQHWVFLESDEVELVASIEERLAERNSPYVNPEYQWPIRMEGLAKLLLFNVKAIVRSTDDEQPLPAPTIDSGPLDRLVALLATNRMSPVQRDAVVEQAATWLTQMFREEAEHGLARVAKGVYRKRTIAKFGEVVDGRVFEDVWKSATAKLPRRRTGGRIPGPKAASDLKQR